MDATIQEAINPSKFIEYTHKLQSKYGHFVAYPEDLNGLVRLMHHPITQELIGIAISTSTTGTNDNKFRIRLENTAGNFVYGTFKCDEVIKCGKDGIFRHVYFSFHFEPDEKQDSFLSFRFDYNPKQIPPLHAHNFDYQNTHIHIVFPDDTLLDLNLIDFCTAMQILSYYFLNAYKYPLSYGEEFTNLIVSTRRTYDEQR